MLSGEVLPGRLRVLVTAACVIIVVAGMKAAADILNTFFLSTLIALAILPLPQWLMRKKLSRGLALGLTLLLVVFGGLAVLSLLGGSIAGLMNALPAYEARLSAMKVDVEGFLSAQGVQVSKLLPEDLLSPSRLLSIAASALSAVGAGLGSALVLIILSVLILAELTEPSETHPREAEPTHKVLASFNDHIVEIRKYITITGWTGLVTAVADYLLMLAVGVDFAITWAVLAFFLSFIPNIGVFFALILPAVLAFLESGWISAVIVAAGFVLINFVVGSVLTPQLMAKGLELRLVVLIAGLLFWTWVLGPPGAIVSVPLTVVVKRIFLSWNTARDRVE